MSSVEGEDHVPDTEDKVDISSDAEPKIASRVACDSENGDAVTKEPSQDHACTADEPSSEQEVSENKTPAQNHESLPDVDKSIKSPPIDASPIDDSSKKEKGGDAKDSSPTADDDEWLDILGTGHLKKKVNILFAAIHINNTLL